MPWVQTGESVEQDCMVCHNELEEVPDDGGVHTRWRCVNCGWGWTEWNHEAVE